MSTKTAEELAAENALLKERIAALEARPGGEFPEEDIRAKVNAGLTRDQAIDVLRQQKLNDDKLAAEAAKGKAPEPAKAATGKK